METKPGLGWILVLIFSYSVHCYEENCDYLDKSRKDRTSHLQCNYGCCGEFKTRYCCSGPIAIVGGIFGGLLFLLVVGVVVAVCYTKYKTRKQIRRTIPSISAARRGIPEPTPPLPTPTVYNTSRLHPPPVITRPRLLLKTPVPPTATTISSHNPASNGYNNGGAGYTNGRSIYSNNGGNGSSATSRTDTKGLNSPKLDRDNGRTQLDRLTEHRQSGQRHTTISFAIHQPTSPPVATNPSARWSRPMTRFQDIPDEIKEMVFKEHHPPPSQLHPPKLHTSKR